ncbi:MAG TPA: chromosomal replication initiator protein DnaA [Acholeplasmatales bacterium]|nr:chromosomal replication initiator protein DnaA [Acholeplasmatales bacterium]
MDDSLKLWQQTLAALKEELDEADFIGLFSEANEVCKTENNFIFVIVPNALIKFRIEKFYTEKLNKILASLSKSALRFKFILKDDAAETEKVSITTKDEINKRPLKAEYTFDNFETGESNRFAFLSAMKVAETHDKIYNPLYIFGDVGLGKTHLMMAIGHYILDNNIDTNVVYTTAQEFTEDYFIHTSTKKGKENIESFYNKYRNADVLLVDDIQFLEGKQATQEEFFKVFEFLHGQNHQIVITSDRSTTELKNMMIRLKSRFNWGLSVDIKVPDKPLRMNILRRKLSFLLENPKDVPNAVLEIISDYFTTNIRDLEGALRRYVTYCVSLNIPFTVENVYVALDRFLPERENEKNNNNGYFDLVKKEVASYYQIPVGELESTSRKQQPTYARQMAIYVLKSLYNPSLKTIGEKFGNRDHATISHSLDKIENLVKTNSLVKCDFDILVKRIHGE